MYGYYTYMPYNIRTKMKSERFELRLDEDILARIDGWRSKQEDIPTRAEAMRRLMDTGLARSSPEVIMFRSADKLIIAMLADLYKHLKVKGDVNPDLVLSALFGGHYWALNWQTTGMPTHLFHNHEDRKEDVDFVISVLDMWDFIEASYQTLAKKDKDRMATEVRFLGFDGHSSNNESGLLHIAEFMVQRLGTFKSAFGGRDLDSHVPMAPKYRKMYRVFEPMRPSLMGTAGLSAGQIIEILKA